MGNSKSKTTLGGKTSRPLPRSSAGANASRDNPEALQKIDKKNMFVLRWTPLRLFRFFSLRSRSESVKRANESSPDIARQTEFLVAIDRGLQTNEATKSPVTQEPPSSNVVQSTNDNALVPPSQNDIGVPIMRRMSSKRGKVITLESQEGSNQSETGMDMEYQNGSVSIPPLSSPEEAPVDQNTDPTTLDGGQTEEQESAPPNQVEVQVANAVEGIRKNAAFQDNFQLLSCIVSLRKLLSIVKNPPIQAVVDSGITPILIQLLDEADASDNMKFELAWAITNIASGSTSHTRHVVDSGGIGALTRLVWHANEELVEQAVWGLGNVAGDCPSFRDLVLNTGISIRLVEIISNPSVTRGCLRNTAWTVSNLCRGKPVPQLEAVSVFVPSMAAYLKSTPIERLDFEAITDMCWALSYICDGANERIDVICNSGLIPTILQCLQAHVSMLIKVPALRTVGNVVSGTDAHTGIVMSAGFTTILAQMLCDRASYKSTFLQDMCWTLSNICAGNREYLQMVLDEPRLMEAMVEIAFDTRYDARIQRECAFVFANALDAANGEQVVQLLSRRVFHALANLVGSNTTTALPGLQVTIAKIGLSRTVQLIQSIDMRAMLQLPENDLLASLLEKNSPVTEDPNLVTALMAIGFRPEICGSSGENSFVLSRRNYPASYQRMQVITVMTNFAAVALVPRFRQRTWLPLDLCRVLKNFLDSDVVADIELPEEELENDGENSEVENENEDGENSEVDNENEDDENSDVEDAYVEGDQEA